MLWSAKEPHAASSAQEVYPRPPHGGGSGKRTAGAARGQTPSPLAARRRPEKRAKVATARRRTLVSQDPYNKVLSAGTSPGTDAIHIFGLKLEQSVNMGKAPGLPSAGTSPGTDGIHVFRLQLKQNVIMGKAPERPSAGTSPGTDAIHVFGLRLEQKVTMGRAPGHPSAGTPQAAMPPGSNAPWVSPTIASGLTMGTRRSGKPGPRQ